MAEKQLDEELQLRDTADLQFRAAAKEADFLAAYLRRLGEACKGLDETEPAMCAHAIGIRKKLMKILKDLNP